MQKTSLLAQSILLLVLENATLKREPDTKETNSMRHVTVMFGKIEKSFLSTEAS